MINEQLLWNLLTPDEINPSEKGGRRGEIYGVVVNSPVPLIKIGHGKNSIDRVGTWIKTYPEEWTKDSMFIFHIKKTDRIECEKQIHNVLGSKKLGKNAISGLIRQHTNYDPDQFELDGRTEWFHVDEEVNDFFLKTFNVDIIDWWSDHQESDPVTEEEDNSKTLIVEEDIDPGYSKYLLKRFKELFFDKKAEWDEICPYSKEDESYRKGFEVYYWAYFNEMIPQFKEEYRQIEFKVFFDKCNENQEYLIESVFEESPDHEDTNEVFKAEFRTKIQEQNSRFEGEYLKKKNEPVPGGAVVAGTLTTPLLVKIFKDHTPLETTGIVVTLVLTTVMIWRFLTK